MKKTAYETISSYLPERICTQLNDIPVHIRDKLCEIRLRVGRPVSLVQCNCLYYVTMSGNLSENGRTDNLLIVTIEDVQEILRRLCRYSVHSFERELRQGYFTIENGVRVGVSGVRNDSDSPLKYAGGFNFRIAREVIGCAENIFGKLYSTQISSVLVCGGPNSGKTTILRDLCRLCGNKYKVTVIDERSEISASVDGLPFFDTGLQTDILEGINRCDGIISAIRTLSPHIIFCDEISTCDDAEALINGYGCGVKFISTVHAESLADLYKRQGIELLLEKGVFDYAVFLQGESFPGKVKEIRRLK